MYRLHLFQFLCACVVCFFLLILAYFLFCFLWLLAGYCIFKTICRNGLKSYVKVSFPDQTFICFYQLARGLSIWDHLNPCSKLEVPWITQIIQTWITTVQWLVYFQFTFILKIVSCLGSHLNVGRVVRGWFLILFTLDGSWTMILYLLS